LARSVLLFEEVVVPPVEPELPVEPLVPVPVVPVPDVEVLLVPERLVLPPVL
jgi:hypothetical protein